MNLLLLRRLSKVVQTNFNFIWVELITMQAIHYILELKLQNSC